MRGKENVAPIPRKRRPTNTRTPFRVFLRARKKETFFLFNIWISEFLAFARERYLDDVFSVECGNGWAVHQICVNFLNQRTLKSIKILIEI